MRIVLLAAILAMIAGGGAAFAQSTTEGPLAAPDATPVAKPPKAKSLHRKPTKMARRTPPAHDDTPNPATSVPRHVAAPSGGTSGADPLSFGMKWNGTNDSALQTRQQNYDGSNPGTGAEVGMKLHF